MPNAVSSDAMKNTIPSAADVAARLEPLDNAQLERLAALSGVPFHTLRKIKIKETKDPRIDTVRAFLPHLQAVAKPTRA